MAPLTNLLKKDAPFDWSPVHQAAVDAIKHKIASAPTLAYFDPTKATTLYTDAFAFAIGGWIGQRDSTNPEALDRPVLYWSRKCKPAETRYGTHERELLALLELLRIDRPYVEGRPFTAKTDHQALKWLHTQPQRSRRQAAWIEPLQSFDMTIEYLPGRQNRLADILSRRPDYTPNCPKCDARIVAAAAVTTGRSALLDRPAEWHAAAVGADDAGTWQEAEAAVAHDSAAEVASTSAESSKLPAGDCAIMNYALALEHLERTFYEESLGWLSAEDFYKANIPNAQKVYLNFVHISQHERQHVKTLQRVITTFCGTPLPPDVKSFLAVARLFEKIGVSAYDGALALIATGDIQTAAGVSISRKRLPGGGFLATKKKKKKKKKKFNYSTAFWFPF
ncbi:MAG: hypothetical protein BJ554DRAFT_6685 [Olpidium bornovanus]|uniref:Reverse transcriptase RNase H-like domain-containing protein n=1 Tax=Olpidium bornovanus TaxID=278681 RepID=A0A8H8DK19_9FUNG|nr:MAG: hypothetical protein BJ554DRAFT_6685 [Olpidium bornovanus]